jgi:hypothetical protein
MAIQPVSSTNFAAQTAPVAGAATKLANYGVSTISFADKAKADDKAKAPAEKGFFGKTLDSIKSFFCKIGNYFKNLFLACFPCFAGKKEEVKKVNDLQVFARALAHKDNAGKDVSAEFAKLPKADQALVKAFVLKADDKAKMEELLKTNDGAIAKAVVTAEAQKTAKILDGMPAREKADDVTADDLNAVAHALVDTSTEARKTFGGGKVLIDAAAYVAMKGTVKGLLAPEVREADGKTVKTAAGSLFVEVAKA